MAKMARKIQFVKMQGTGNDFIMLDNRGGCLKEHELARCARIWCERRVSVGADGLMLLEPSKAAEYKMRLFNADGSEAEMCGNGARCMARFAKDLGVAGDTQRFETLAGIIGAELTKEGARVQLSRPSPMTVYKRVTVAGEACDLYFMDTGVPHAVRFVDDVKAANVRDVGREIRNHDLFRPRGTNANFVQLKGDGRIAVRTYERGVEDETLACGTGSTASALIAGLVKGYASPVKVATFGGATLTVHFKADGDAITEVLLEGSVVTVYRGEMDWSG